MRQLCYPGSASSRCKQQGAPLLQRYSSTLYSGLPLPTRCAGPLGSVPSTSSGCDRASEFPSTHTRACSFKAQYPLQPVKPPKRVHSLQGQAPGTRLPVVFATNGNKNDNSNRRNNSNRNSWFPWNNWWQKLTSMGWKGALKVFFNLVMLYSLFRMWPPGGRSPAGLQTEGDVTIIQVPFSDFARTVKENQVQTVVVDGPSISFMLRPNSPLLADTRFAPTSNTKAAAAAAAGAAAAAATPKASSSSGSSSKRRDWYRRGEGAKGGAASSGGSSSGGGSSGASGSSTAEAPATLILTTIKPPDYAVPYSVLEANGVTFSAADKARNRLTTIMMYAVYAAVLVSVLQRLPLKLLPGAQSGAGKKHRQDKGGVPPVLFADVAGVDEAKEELQEIVEYLRAPERFKRLGARPPNGVLLVGPPGTGKTLLAKAVAGEADVPFFSTSASEFVELYVGMGASRVRELFATARKEAPAIVFIDEIDAVAKGRDMRLRSVGNDEREQTLNQLLTELDGFDTAGGEGGTLICIAATNRPDVLDAALLRPGRFDRRVAVERPDREGREQILKVHLTRRALPLAEDVSPASLAAATTGFTGADLANLVNEAALLAGRRGKNEVGREEFDAAVLRAVAGIEKKRSILRGVEKEVVAKHEVGHAVVGTAVNRLLPLQASEVEKLSIIPRSGGALGFTYIPPKSEDRALMFDSELRGQLALLMGGRAAEAATCGAVSTGAMDDIKRATDLAYRAVAEYGLSPVVGPVNVGVLSSGGADEAALVMKEGGGMAGVVEAEVKSLLESAMLCASACLATNKELHAGLSRLLAAHERVEGAELASWLGHVQVPDMLSDFVLHGKRPQREDLAALMAQQPTASEAVEAALAALEQQAQQRKAAAAASSTAAATPAAAPEQDASGSSSSSSASSSITGNSSGGGGSDAACGCGEAGAVESESGADGVRGDASDSIGSSSSSGTGSSGEGAGTAASTAGGATAEAGSPASPAPAA